MPVDTRLSVHSLNFRAHTKASSTHHASTEADTSYAPLWNDSARGDSVWSDSTWNSMVMRHRAPSLMAQTAACLAGEARTLVYPAVHRHLVSSTLRPLSADTFAVLSLSIDNSMLRNSGVQTEPKSGQIHPDLRKQQRLTKQQRNVAAALGPLQLSCVADGVVLLVLQNVLVIS